MLKLPKCLKCKTVMTLAIDCIMYISAEGGKLETALESDNDPVRIFCSNCGDYLSQREVEIVVPSPDAVLNSQES